MEEGLRKLGSAIRGITETAGREVSDNAYVLFDTAHACRSDGLLPKVNRGGWLCFTVAEVPLLELSGS